MSKYILKEKTNTNDSPSYRGERHKIDVSCKARARSRNKVGKSAQKESALDSESETRSGGKLIRNNDYVVKAECGGVCICMCKYMSICAVCMFEFLRHTYGLKGCVRNTV